MQIYSLKTSINEICMNRYVILTIAKNLSKSDGCDDGVVGVGAAGVVSTDEVVRFQRLNKAPSFLVRQRSSSLPAAT